MLKIFRTFLFLFFFLFTVSFFPQKVDSVAKNKLYEILIKKADRHMLDGSCLEAKKMYEQAVATKSLAEYPKTKIKEIDLAWKQISETGTVTPATKCCEVSLRNESYHKAVNKGDNCIALKDYTCATAAYNEALKIKPGMAYPGDQIKRINELEQKLKDTNYIKKSKKYYNMALDTAGKLYRKKDYEGAAKMYRAANSISEDMLWKNDFLKDSITSCNKRAYDQKKEKEIYDGLYEMLIKIGDDDFANKKYKNALACFQKASKMKPNEAYPKKRIQETKKMIGKK